MKTPLLWLSRHLAYPDNFLHIIIDRVISFKLFSTIFLQRWKPFMTKHINNIWSTTFDDNGYGPLVAADYRAMMESQGLSVTVAKSMELSYKITEVTC